MKGKGTNKNLEISVLLEDFNGKFDLIAEQTAQIPEIKNKVDDLTEDMKIVKEDIFMMKGDIFMMKGDMVIVKTDLEFIKHALKKKVDVDEFAVLERRVTMLESRGR